MTDLRVYRSNQLADVPDYAKRWGFNKITDLEQLLQLEWNEIERRYGALARYIPVTNLEDLEPTVPNFNGFVPAGWVNDMLNAIKHGIYILQVYDWSHIPEDLGVPPNVWNSYLCTNTGLVLLALAYDKDMTPVKWPVRIVARAEKRGFFESREAFSEAIAKGLEVYPDYGVIAVDMETGDLCLESGEWVHSSQKNEKWQYAAIIEW